MVDFQKEKNSEYTAPYVNPNPVSENHKKLSDIEFDVAVTVSDGKSAEGGGGLSVMGVSIGGKGASEQTPSHCIWNIKAHEFALAPSEGKIDPLVRVIGESKPGQCIWAFINGIDNTKAEALEAAERISKTAKGEQVLSMPNDTIWWPIDFLLCIILKTSFDTPIITWTVKFLKYLLTLAKQREDSPQVIVFLHSQGAIFIEHAIELLTPSERKQLRIFTFGGGSFIPPGKCHQKTTKSRSSGF